MRLKVQMLAGAVLGHGWVQEAPASRAIGQERPVGLRQCRRPVDGLYVGMPLAQIVAGLDDEAAPVAVLDDHPVFRVRPAGPGPAGHPIAWDVATTRCRTRRQPASCRSCRCCRSCRFESGPRVTHGAFCPYSTPEIAHLKINFRGCFPPQKRTFPLWRHFELMITNYRMILRRQ
jgi:hypothetical protein